MSIFIPFHKCKVELEIAGTPIPKANQLTFKDSPSENKYIKFMELIVSNIPINTQPINVPPSSLTIQYTLHEIIVNGPGKILLEAKWDNFSLPPISEDLSGRIMISLLPTGKSHPVIVEKTLSLP